MHPFWGVVFQSGGLDLCFRWSAFFERGGYECCCERALVCHQVTSKKVAAECIAEWTAGVMGGKESRFHRVARMFLQVGSPLRHMLDSYAASDLELSAYPALYIELRGYALNIIVSRRVEGIHSQVKRTFQRKLHCMVPRVSTAVRQKEMESLIDSPAFRQWLKPKWCARDWLRASVAIAFPRKERAWLKTASYVDLLKLFYQCSAKAMYQDPALDSVTANEWKIESRKHLQPVVPMVAESVHYIVGYLKHLFSQTQVYWSMPRRLFEDHLRPHLPPHDLHDVLSWFLVVLGTPRPIIDFANQVVFRVSSATPESRDCAAAGHMDILRTAANIEVFDPLPARGGRLEIDDSKGRLMQIDLAKFAHWDILMELWCWPSAGTMCAPCVSKAGLRSLEGISGRHAG